MVLGRPRTISTPKTIEKVYIQKLQQMQIFPISPLTDELEVGKDA